MKLFGFELTVFDGVPRNKQQIEATAGGMVGEARRDGKIPCLCYFTSSLLYKHVKAGLKINTGLQA